MYVRKRGSQMPGVRTPARLNLLRFCVIFLGAQYGTCLVSPFLVPVILRWLLDFLENFCMPAAEIIERNEDNRKEEKNK